MFGIDRSNWSTQTTRDILQKRSSPSELQRSRSLRIPHLQVIGKVIVKSLFTKNAANELRATIEFAQKYAHHFFAEKYKLSMPDGPLPIKTPISCDPSSLQPLCNRHTLSVIEVLRVGVQHDNWRSGLWFSLIPGPGCRSIE